jgi:hypothetical protein
MPCPICPLSIMLSMHVPPAAVSLTTHPLSYELSYEKIYNVWKKQYYADVLEKKHPGKKLSDESLKSTFKAAFDKVTQEEKDAIYAELDE